MKNSLCFLTPFRRRSVTRGVRHLHGDQEGDTAAIAAATAAAAAAAVAAAATAVAAAATAADVDAAAAAAVYKFRHC